MLYRWSRMFPRRRTTAVVALGLVVLGVILLLVHPNHSAGAVQPDRTHWVAPVGNVPFSQPSAPAAKPTPLDVVTEAPSAPPSTAPAPPAPDPAQAAAAKSATSTWGAIVAHAPKGSLNSAQRQVPAIRYVAKPTCTRWQYDKMPLAIGDAVRYCNAAIEVVAGAFNAMGQNDPDAQSRGVAAAFMQHAAANLDHSQAYYKGGSRRITNDVLGSLQFIVTTALQSAYGMGEESTFVVMEPSDQPDSKTIRGYYNLDLDQGAWAD